MDFCLSRSNRTTWEEFAIKSQFPIAVPAGFGSFNRCNVIFRKKYARLWISTSSGARNIGDSVAYLENVFGDNARITPQMDGKAIGVIFLNSAACDALINWLGEERIETSSESKDLADGFADDISTLPLLHLSRDSKGSQTFFSEKFSVTPLSLEGYRQAGLSLDECYLNVEIEISDRFHFAAEEFVSRCFNNGITIGGIAPKESGQKITSRKIKLEPIDLAYPITKDTGLAPRKLAGQIRNFIRHADCPYDAVFFLISCDFKETFDSESFSNWCKKNSNYLLARQRELFSEEQSHGSLKMKLSDRAVSVGKLHSYNLSKTGLDYESGEMAQESKGNRKAHELITTQADVSICVETQKIEQFSPNFEDTLIQCAENRDFAIRGTTENISEMLHYWSLKQDFVKECTKAFSKYDGIRLHIPAGAGKTAVASAIVDNLRTLNKLGSFVYIVSHQVMVDVVRKNLSFLMNEKIQIIEDIETLRGDLIKRFEGFVFHHRNDLEDFPTELFDLVIVDDPRVNVDPLSFKNEKTLILSGVPLKPDLYNDSWVDLSNYLVNDLVQHPSRIFSPISLLVLPQNSSRGVHRLESKAIKHGVLLSTIETLDASIIEISGFCKIPLLIDRIGFHEASDDMLFDSSPKQDVSKAAELFCMLSLRNFLFHTKLGHGEFKLSGLRSSYLDTVDFTNASDELILNEVEGLFRLTRKLSNLGNDFPEVSEFANSLLFETQEPERYKEAFRIAHVAHSAILRKGASDFRKSFSDKQNNSDGPSAVFLYQVSVALHLCAHSQNIDTGKLLDFLRRLPDQSYNELLDLSGMGFPKSSEKQLKIEQGYAEIPHVKEVVEPLFRDNDHLPYTIFHDPACGIGLFNLLVLEKLNSVHGPEGLLPKLKEISGCDTDPLKINLAKVLFLYRFAGIYGLPLNKDQTLKLHEYGLISPDYEYGEFFLNLVPSIYCGDSFKKSPFSDGKVGFLFCDPPFDDLLDDGSYNHHRYIERIAQSVKLGSLAGVVLPQHFLESSRDSSIRKMLIKEGLISDISELQEVRIPKIAMNAAGHIEVSEHQNYDVSKSEKVLLFLSSAPNESLQVNPLIGKPFEIRINQLTESGDYLLSPESLRKFSRSAKSPHLFRDFNLENHIGKATQEFEKVIRFLEKTPHVSCKEFNLSEICFFGDSDSLKSNYDDGKDFVYARISDRPSSSTPYVWLKSVKGEARHAYGPSIMGIYFIKPIDTESIDLDYLLFWISNNPWFKSLVEVSNFDFGLLMMDQRIIDSTITLPSLYEQRSFVKHVTSPFGQALLGKPKRRLNQSKEIKEEWANFLFRYSRD
ncbi:hypothetical protein OAV01_05385 [Opitutales bacterium]|nr:hypothetical protein [Opitutales bacterium]